MDYPFFQVARMRGLPYAVVLRIADVIEGKRKGTQEDYDSVGMSDWRWINDAVQSEQRRRHEVGKQSVA